MFHPLCKGKLHPIPGSIPALHDLEFQPLSSLPPPTASSKLVASVLFSVLCSWIMEMLSLLNIAIKKKNLSWLCVGANARLKAGIMMQLNIPCCIRILSPFYNIISKISLQEELPACDLSLQNASKCGLSQPAWVQIPDLPLTSSGNLGQVV